MKTIVSSLVLSTAILLSTTALAVPEFTAPEGFEALFNGKNLDGWWGLKTENPADWMALDEAALAKKKAQSIKNMALRKILWRKLNGINLFR